MLNSDLFQLFQQLVNTQGVLTFTFFKVKLGSHSDVGYSSMTEVQTVGEEPEQEESLEENKAGEKRDLERQRSYSIVKPAVEEIDAEKDDTEQPGVNRDNKDEQTTPGPVRYKVIKNLFPEPTKVRRDSTDSTNLEEKVRGWTEDGSRAASEAPTTSQHSLSCESLERLESLPQSPAKDETTPLAPRPGSFLEKVTITEDDPLGALSAQSCTPEMNTPREKVGMPTVQNVTIFWFQIPPPLMHHYQHYQ